MDELMHSLCCVLIVDCFVLAPKQGTTFGWSDARWL